MKKKFLFFLFTSLILCTCTQPAFAQNTLELNFSQPSQLAERKSIWPDWRLPYSFKRPGLREDLIYPDWFEGDWNVESKTNGNENGDLIFHSAKFINNSLGEIIADREFNTKSYALGVKNGGFLSVKNDPKSPNRQFAKLSEDRYLETKIIGRLQEKINNNIFVTDELILQILHTPELSRISQVETLTEFRKCNSDNNSFDELSNFNICAEQFQAIYNEPGKGVILRPIKTEKIKLTLRKIGHY